MRQDYIPGQLVTCLRMISTDVIEGLDVVDVIATINLSKFFVTKAPIDLSQFPARQLTS